MDLATVTGGLGAANHVLSLLKGVAEGVKASGKAEGVSQILDLQMALMELLQKHQAVIDDNTNLRAQVKALEEKLKDQASLRFHYQAYWRELEGGVLDGPYSQLYWELERRLVRLRFHGMTVAPPRYIFQETHPRNESGQKSFTYIPESFLTENRLPNLDELKRE